ncbi:MAG: YfcE family phosphodiesterase [Oliverpabstia sp.]
MKVILDAGRIEEKGKSHEYLKEMLQLPEHYGKNLDALHDCLTEMDKTEILWDNIEHAGIYFRRVYLVFQRACVENPGLSMRKFEGKKIAVLSDTHGLLRPEVTEILHDCDGAIHAGDINSREILNQIWDASGRNKPFYVVRGNNDKAWAMDLPLTMEFTLCGVDFLLVHNKKDVPANKKDTQIIILGHSHKYLEEEKDGCLWLNPGSCGKRRFHQEITMAVLYLEETPQPGSNGWWVKKIEIPQDTAVGAEHLQKTPPQGLIPQENLSGIVQEIIKRMDKGQSVEVISKKLNIHPEFAEEICRIRVTHPGVSVDGIVDKIEVNRSIYDKKTISTGNH